MSHEREIIYYNVGMGCAARLAVSIHSLRDHYQGRVTILSEGEQSHSLCKRIGAALDAEVLEWSSGVPSGKNAHFVAKTKIYMASRSVLTIALDSDTLVVQPLEDLFELAETAPFGVAQFANWRTSGHIMSKRIRRWEGVQGTDIESALLFGPAINTGVFTFRRDARIFEEWYHLALRGRDLPIPDETSCQLLLHRYAHLILDSCWNRSCKHDDPMAPDTRIVHFHGRKHCRPGLRFHGNLWMARFERMLQDNIAGIRDWSPAGDCMLKRHFRDEHRLAVDSCEVAARWTKSMSTAITPTGPLRVVLGAGRRKHPGWIVTDRDTLDIRHRFSWENVFGSRRAARLLAEHVWEHLTFDEMCAAQALAYEFLEPGGCLRIAVPDKFHPDPEYIARVMPGGSHWTAKVHCQLLCYRSLGNALKGSGFEVRLLEYWDENGEFHFRPWSSDDGHIKRSAFHDRRNRRGALRFTSLIVDAYKPIFITNAPAIHE